MKIKLDAQGSVSVLTVSGSVAGPDFDVLKAGLLKLLGAGKNPLIIDLTQAAIESAAKVRFSELTTIPNGDNSVFMIASTEAGIGSAPTVEDCLKLIASPAAKLLAQEAQLKAKLVAAQSQKTDLVKKLDETAGLGAEIKKHRRENTELRGILALLEEQIQSQVKDRKPPILSETLQEGWSDVREVIAKVFAPTGLLKAKAG